MVKWTISVLEEKGKFFVQFIIFRDGPAIRVNERLEKG